MGLSRLVVPNLLSSLIASGEVWLYTSSWPIPFMFASWGLWGGHSFPAMWSVWSATPMDEEWPRVQPPGHDDSALLVLASASIRSIMRREIHAKWVACWVEWLSQEPSNQGWITHWMNHWVLSPNAVSSPCLEVLGGFLSGWVPLVPLPHLR